MGLGFRGMKAQLTTNVPGGLSTFNNRSLIREVYKTPAIQDKTFYHLLANSQMTKRISNYPRSYSNYVYLRAKYGKFTQANIRY